MKDISIVIPNWNGEEFLKSNLTKVINSAGGSEIIVVDDDSSDNSVKLLESQFPGIVIIRHIKNMGFAQSCNDGVKKAKGKIVVLLNTDVIPDINFLKPLPKYFDDPDIFAVSLGEVNSGPGSAIFKDGFVELVRKDHESKSRYAFWASGGQSAYSKEKWLDLGGFDTIFKPFYWEDIDLSYRAWKIGYKIIWEPEAKVVHQHKGTINTHFSKNYINCIGERNRLLFIWKNISDNKMLNQHFKALISNIIHLKSLKPLFAALLSLPIIMMRKKVKNNSREIQDSTIFEYFKE